MPAKILVVDDEPDLELLMRQKFRQQIRQQEWQFTFARSGTEALAILQADQEFDVVLTDINMPGMDGLTLLGKLPEINPILRAVIITAYGDIGDIRTAMHRGAYDFLTKPLDLQDLEFTITRALQHVQQHVRHVARLTAAAAAIEEGGFESASLPGSLPESGRLGTVGPGLSTHGPGSAQP